MYSSIDQFHEAKNIKLFIYISSSEPMNFFVQTKRKAAQGKRSSRLFRLREICLLLGDNKKSVKMQLCRYKCWQNIKG